MKNIYGKLADEYYNMNKHKSNKSQYIVLKPFIKLLKKGSTILDVGCGIGSDSNILQKEGMKVTSIDISKEMIKYVKQDCKSKVMNFFDYEGIVDGIVLNAFIHLFKNPNKVFEKLKKIIHQDTIIFVSTTLNKSSKQGIFTKKGYKKKVKRFRRFYTEEELKEVIIKNNFDIISVYYDYEPERNNIWINLILKINQRDFENKRK